MNYQKKRWKHDWRSDAFNHDKFFGAPNPATLPDTLDRPLGPVLDQGPTLRCTGYGSAANGWYIHGKQFNPDWQAAKIGQIQGRTVDDYGGDPNATMKSMRDFGFLPFDTFPMKWQEYSVSGTGMAAWGTIHDDEAKIFDNLVGFFSLKPILNDPFDTIRAAIFAEYNPNTGRGAGADIFVPWYHEWDETIDGVVKPGATNFAGYHRVVAPSWKLIQGKYHLTIQQSYGDSVGDRGFLHFPREVVNTQFYGRGRSLKMLKTATPEQLALAKEANQAGKIQATIFDIWYFISQNFGLWKN